MPNPKNLPAAMKRYRIRQISFVGTGMNDVESLCFSDVASESSWTRGSVVSSFMDGELGSTFGRWMRTAGRVFVDPIDTVLGLREFEKLYNYVIKLDAGGWQSFTASFDTEAYSPRIAEVLRHRVYPRKLQLLAQKITLLFAILGKVRFENVIPRINFHTKEEFQGSITNLCATALNLLPKAMLLLHIPITNDGEDLLSSLRNEINQFSDETKFPSDCTLLYHIIDRTRKPGAHIPKDQEEQDVEMLRIVLGEEHHITMSSMSLLTSRYFTQGRLEMAAKLGEAVLEKRKRVLGEERRCTLSSMHMLGLIYYKQRRIDEALELIQTLLEKRRRVVGEEHPETISTMSLLGKIYIAQGRSEEGVGLLEAVLEKSEHVFGEKHRRTLASIQKLADAYYDLGKLTEAENLVTKLIRRTVPGPWLRPMLVNRHESKLFAFLVEIYRAQGRIEEAGELEEYMNKQSWRVVSSGLLRGRKA